MKKNKKKMTEKKRLRKLLENEDIQRKTNSLIEEIRQ